MLKKSRQIIEKEALDLSTEQSSSEFEDDLPDELPDNLPDDLPVDLPDDLQGNLQIVEDEISFVLEGFSDEEEESSIGDVNEIDYPETDMEAEEETDTEHSLKSFGEEDSNDEESSGKYVFSPDQNSTNGVNDERSSIVDEPEFDSSVSSTTKNSNEVFSPEEEKGIINASSKTNCEQMMTGLNSTLHNFIKKIYNIVNIPTFFCRF